MHDHQRRAWARSRRGFSIVELVVAMMLVAIGLLSLVGANTVLVRRRNEARQRLAAVAAAANRVAQLSSGPCLPVNGAANASGGVSEQWAVRPGPSATREIVDSVHFGARPAHQFVVRTRLPC
jgi:prepilin-type N-terminal cleavage/methylation domain-containing protein